jgi:hypothetical protein
VSGKASIFEPLLGRDEVGIWRVISGLKGAHLRTGRKVYHRFCVGKHSVRSQPLARSVYRRHLIDVGKDYESLT